MKPIWSWTHLKRQLSTGVLARLKLFLMKVVGIDAGYVNFAVCAIDSRDPLRPYYWKNEPLFTGPFSEEKLITALYAWITSAEVTELLGRADVIVLERQLAKKFLAVNLCVRFRYFEKTREVSPNMIGKFFNLPIDRKAKKKAAVELVSSKVVLPIRKGKKDDLADAFLLAKYVVIENFPEQKGDWQFEHERTAKRKVKTSPGKQPAGKQPAAKHRRHQSPDRSTFQGARDAPARSVTAAPSFGFASYLF